MNDKKGLMGIIILMVWLALTAWFMSGCATIDQSKWCDAVPAGSYSVICEVSAQVGTTPENVSRIVKVADLLLLDETHTAQQAYDFFTALENTSKTMQAADGATYGQLVTYVISEYANLPPRVQAAIIILGDFNIRDMNVSVKLLSDYDWWIIGQALAEQKAVLVSFL